MEEVKGVNRIMAGIVNVRYGVSAFSGSFAGQNVEMIYDATQSILNMADDVTVVVNGTPSDFAYIAKENDNIEFVRSAGRKG